jgi:hypothetical protein
VEGKFHGWKEDVPPYFPLRTRVFSTWWKVEAVYVNPLNEAIKYRVLQVNPKTLFVTTQVLQKRISSKNRKCL